MILMSGYTSETLPESAVAAGTQQLRKPFTNAELDSCAAPRVRTAGSSSRSPS